jgi:hypothetical protein
LLVVRSDTTAAERGLSQVWSSYTDFCDAKRVDCRLDVEDDRTASGIEEDEREDGSGRQCAVSWTHSSVNSLALIDRGDTDRGGGWYP